MLEVMKIHNEIVSRKANIDGKEYDYLNLCSKGNSCFQNSTSNSGICQCMVKSVLRQWDYNISRLEADTDIFKTLNEYGSKNELKAILGNPIFAQLGIGVDDIFIICNTFDRELKVARSKETDEDIISRSANALARVGSSITVTSLTDIVAFYFFGYFLVHFF